MIYCKNALLMVGENIQRIRRMRGMSQQELADKIGIHRNNIGRIESGKTNIPFMTLCKIIKALRTSSQDVLPF